jgi:glycosyltransferase involved in cell wall biosynthesis
MTNRSLPTSSETHKDGRLRSEKPATVPFARSSVQQGYERESTLRLASKNSTPHVVSPAPRADLPEHRLESDISTFRPLRIGFVVGTFSFGGSETETIELVYGADPRLLEFSGIAVCIPQPLPEGEPPKDGSFPLIYVQAGSYPAQTDSRVKLVNHFREAVEVVTRQSDILITWGVPNLWEYFPAGRLPKIVVLSKDSGTWAKHFLSYNSMLTRHYVANSSLAAAAFPERIRNHVQVIHNGVNPERVRPRLSRVRQRKMWGFGEGDKIAGYLGRIERDKGIGKTVEAIAELPPEWKGVFIGVNPNSRYARELAQDCERAIPNRYRLLEWTHDVGSALAAFDVFCHPSEHEGFSNSTSEAWLAGVPTVYTRNTGVIPDLGELGVGVSPYADGTEIAQALLEAYGNKRLVERAREVIRSSYLTVHNVKRWTDYLIELGRLPVKRRVFLTLPAHLENDVDTWLQILNDLEIDLEPCCIAIEGTHENTLANVLNPKYDCSYFTICGPDDLKTLVGYTNPDLIVAFSSPATTYLMSGCAAVRTIVLPNLSKASLFLADRWRGRLAQQIMNVLQ